MGANIGTSVTSTIVAMTQVGDREVFRRAFAGGTVHDMFNWLTVLVILPIEWATNYLRKMTSAILNITNSNSSSSVGEVQILRVITRPFTDLIVKVKNWQTKSFPLDGHGMCVLSSITVASPISRQSRDLISTWMSHLLTGETSWLTWLGSKLQNAVFFFAFSELKKMLIGRIFLTIENRGLHYVQLELIELWQSHEGACVRIAVGDRARSAIVVVFIKTSKNGLILIDCLQFFYAGIC